MSLLNYIAIVVLFSATTYSQTATLKGVVTDESGAIVAGATVTLTNNSGATVVAGSALESLSDNPDDLINDLIAIAGPGAGPGGASVFIDGFADGQVPAKEAIREIRINQNPFSPEYDKIGTGRIEILTKPGTNQFHGAEGFNVSNDFWNSRNPYAQQKAPFFLKEYSG